MYRPDTNTVALQVALRRFDPPRRGRPVVWLTGASHIGDTNYYAELQRHLDQQSVVLFEGVRGGPHRQARAEAEKTPSIQANLAHSLGLVFQLDAIDYDRPNFRNSDLSIKQLHELLAASPGGDAPDRDFQSLLALMDGSSFFGMMMNVAINLIDGSPRLQALTKLVFIETLGKLEGDLAQVGGLPPSMKQLIVTLIHERNKVVLAELTRLSTDRARPRSVAVFFGAAHMDDLEQRLVSELGYRPGVSRWLTAFSVNCRQAGLAPSDVAMVSSIVDWQMKGLKVETRR